jgi:hypothetical protein
MDVQVMNNQPKAKNSITIIAVIAMEILGNRGRGLIGTACLTHDQKTWPPMRKCLLLVIRKYSIRSIVICGIGKIQPCWMTKITLPYQLCQRSNIPSLAHVRTLHGMSLTFDLAGRKKELEDVLASAQQEMEAAKATYEAATEKAEAAQEGSV